MDLTPPSHTNRARLSGSGGLDDDGGAGAGFDTTDTTTPSTVDPSSSSLTLSSLPRSSSSSSSSPSLSPPSLFPPPPPGPFTSGMSLEAVVDNLELFIRSMPSEATKAMKISELVDFLQTQWSANQARQLCTALIKHLPAIIEAYDTNTPVQQKTNKTLYFYVMDRYKNIRDESKPHYQLHRVLFAKFGIHQPKHRDYTPEEFHPVSLDRVKKVKALIEAQGGIFDCPRPMNQLQISR